MNIRRADKNDKKRIEELLSQVLEVHHNVRPDIFKSGTRKYTSEALDGIIADDTRPIFVAEADGNILGYAFCIFIQHVDDNILTDVKTLYIDDLCVDESARGKGIGRELYNFAVNYAKENGCYNLTLNVWADNVSALGFYEALGLHKQKIGMELIL